MLHYIHLLYPYQDGTSGLKAAVGIPVSGNIVGVDIKRESAQSSELGTDQVIDIRTGANLSSVATIFGNPAHKPRFVGTALTGAANTAAFPVAVLKGQTIAMYRETGFTFHAGNRLLGTVIIDDGILNETEVDVSTGVLADLATENLTAPLGKSFVLNRIAVNRASRVTVYRSAAARTADAGRPIGELPGAGAGVIVDANLTPGNLDLPLSPMVYGATAESPRSGDIAIRVQNRSGSAGAVNATFTINKFEA